MKNHFFILFILVSSLLIGAEESLTHLSLQAEALWEAHDYLEANKIYEKLSLYPLSTWQKARLIYNQSTTQLAQSQILESIKLFHKIDPIDLALPQFGCDLLLNEGIAYLQYAQQIVQKSASLIQQAILIEKSLQLLEQAQKLNCQLQKKEQIDTNSSCYSDGLIDEWIKVARTQLYVVHQQKRQRWMEQAPIESIASLLDKQLQSWIHQINNQSIQEDRALQNATIRYFRHQAESFISLWNMLQAKALAPSQQAYFNQALALYLNALKKLTALHLTAAMQEMTQSLDVLAKLTFKTDHPLQQLISEYEELLLQEHPSLLTLQDLLAKFSSLTVEKEHLLALEQIKEYLKKSLDAFKVQSWLQVRFFLILGFGSVHLLQEKSPTPLFILQQALEQANYNLEACFLITLMAKDSLKPTEVKSLLKDQQHMLLAQVTPFIPTVLNEQRKHFLVTQDADSNCQQSPWDQVIPLYDQGYQAAYRAEQQLGQASLDIQTIMDAQQQTIDNWQQAVNLLLHPPSQKTPTSASSQKINESFRLIQEMYLEDQSQPKQTTEELHSW